MKKAVIISMFFYLLASIKLDAQNMDSLRGVLGEYTAYKWINLPVTDGIDANSYLGKKMLLYPNKIVLFVDSNINVKYQFRKEAQIDFFREFRHFKWKRMNILEDSITVMEVITSNHDASPPIDIIVEKNFLIAQYGGFFYFFKKESTK